MQLGAGDDTAPQRLTVADGAVTVAGPRGFCIDEEASPDAAGGGLVVLAACRSLGAPALLPVTPRLLTASVAASGSALEMDDMAGALRAFFESDAGRGALSRSGRAQDVTLLEAEASGGAFVMRVSDAGPFPGGSVARRYWRAIFLAGGRFVTLSVYDLPPRGLDLQADGPARLPDAAAARRVLDSFIAATRRASAPLVVPAAAAVTAAADEG